MSQKPVSAYEKSGGMAWFPRMLSKIRLMAAGELSPEYHANLGRGADGLCLKFLRVPYDAVQQRTLAGGTDEEVLEWCYDFGRRLDENDLTVWNGFILKLGWRDMASQRLQKVKADTGLADRRDIQTMPDFFDVDEGRKP